MTDSLSLVVWLAFGLSVAAMLGVIVLLILRSARIYQRGHCPDCDRIVSRVADFCPDCGKPWPFGGH